MRWRFSFALVAVLLMSITSASAQPLTQRGFVEVNGIGFFENAPNDSTQAVVNLLAREELFAKPTDWLQFAGGIDMRANSHDEVDGRWTFDVSDRGVRRPRLALRRLTATVTRGPVTIDIGKQFIRWGTTDIVTPTDRFAPKDFLDPLNTDFLGVTALRTVARVNDETFDVVWTPRMTPSRIPLLDQRWTNVPPEGQGLPLREAETSVPNGSQFGLRWGHTQGSLEYSFSFFNGFNHLPDIAPQVVTRPDAPTVPVAIDIARIYPPIRTFGGDMSLPMPWLTLKAEAAYVTTSSSASDEYGLYVVQLERQRGEWMFIGGYAGEIVSRRAAFDTFAPDRGTSQSVLGRAALTIDVNRSLAFETAVRQNLHGAYGKAEFSQASGQHWRVTATGVVLIGRDDDFFGQYRRNSHAMLTARYSF
ncbi:MAG: hypothetical protein LBQ09_10980 [Acidobacteriaceae bacterium]|nr:hypothetical protein [Acidobacteriaceae bacterium]